MVPQEHTSVQTHTKSEQALLEAPTLEGPGEPPAEDSAPAKDETVNNVHNNRLAEDYPLVG